MIKVNILGANYNFTRDDLNNPTLAQNDGYCQIYDKNICVRKKEYMAGESDAAKAYREAHVIRHELIHAIAEESGVEYGDNEALVDWIAHIIPIVNKAFDEIKESGGI